jgi:hypothetical protein
MWTYLPEAWFVSYPSFCHTFGCTLLIEDFHVHSFVPEGWYE